MTLCSSLSFTPHPEIARIYVACRSLGCSSLVGSYSNLSSRITQTVLQRAPWGAGASDLYKAQVCTGRPSHSCLAGWLACPWPPCSSLAWCVPPSHSDHACLSLGTLSSPLSLLLGPLGLRTSPLPGPGHHIPGLWCCCLPRSPSAH